MKEWLKFTGLSFFSDKTAKQAPRRGLGNMFLAAIFAVVFLLLGLVAAYTLTFGASYRNAPALVATVNEAFSTNGAAIEITDGVLHADRIIDTVSNEADRQNYFRGCHIVVDSRKADAFDDFYAFCVSGSGKEISYEEYLGLDDDVKTLYAFKVRYSGRERVIDEEWVSRCEAFLDAQTDADTANAYAEVKKLGDGYASALYNLYVRTYYPPMTAYETDGNAPKTRNFYFYNYTSNSEILFVFCDSMVGSFTTAIGANRIFYGYYGNMPDGKVGTSAADIENFITASFDGATAITVYSAFLAFFSVLPFVFLVVFAAVVVLFCFTKLLKLDDLTFGGAAKTVCAFLAWAALITALVTFAFGFVVSQSILAWLESVALFAVLIIRIAVMLIGGSVARKQSANAAENQEHTTKNLTE